MMYKCKYCDDKGEKSIDSKVYNYIKIKNYYCHVDCYINYLVSKKNKTLLEASTEAKFILDSQKRNMDETDVKIEFIDYIQKYYNIILTRWQYTKINQVVQGKYKSIMKEGISYFDLYEMWQNKKFLRKLEKISYRMNIKKENRFDYDLGIVVKEYDKYKKNKIKKEIENIDIKDINQTLNNTKNALKNKSNKNNSEYEEVDIYDML